MIKNNIWPSVPLGEVLTKKNDKIVLDPETSYKQLTVKLWGEGVTLRREVKGAGIAAETQGRVRSGDFILSRIDARHGAFGVVPDTLDGAVVSQDFPVFETHTDRVNPQFLSWLAKTDWFIELCRRSSEGSTNRVRLQEGAFLQYSIPLPPLDEQTRIVERLESVKSKIAEHARTIQSVEVELSSALRNAFRKIVVGATPTRMGDVAPLVRRVVKIDQAEKYVELGVRSFFKGTFHRRTLHGSGFTWQNLFRVRQGDLIFSNLMAWEQAIAVAKDIDDGCVGNHRILTCEVDLSRSTPNFLLYYFTTEEGFNKVLNASPGSIARNKTLSAEQLPDIEVPIPSLDGQLWFDEILKRAGHARSNSSASARELDLVLPAMLNQLFPTASGSDADKK
jgi:type I restriction enzyme, S subunit